MKKVLIAIDYNPSTQKIAETGLKYARAMNAEFCLVHTIPETAYYPMEYSPIMGFEGFSPDCAFKDIMEQENDANRFLDAIVKYLGDNKIRTKVLNGKIHEALLQYAAEYKADMIIMGDQRHNGSEKILADDVLAKILRNAEIPILIIPGDEQNIPWITQQQDTLQYI